MNNQTDYRTNEQIIDDISMRFNFSNWGFLAKLDFRKSLIDALNRKDSTIQAFKEDVDRLRKGIQKFPHQVLIPESLFLIQENRIKSLEEACKAVLKDLKNDPIDQQLSKETINLVKQALKQAEGE